MNLSTALTTTFLIALALLGHVKTSFASAFEPPPGQGEPGSTAGGASRPIRSTCVLSNTLDQLTVLAPKSYLGLTLQARPTFWVYLPATRANTLEFSLFDRQRKGIYQTRIDVANKKGFVKITLPESAPALNLNQSYNWTVALVCNPKRRTEDWVAGGWIQRQASPHSLQQKLNLATTDSDRATLYARSQFWYDAISLMINSKQAGSESGIKLWSATLEAAGLGRIDNPHTQKIVNR
ncbi:DUF928 domain-containing protein [Pseudanabaenaceae cyanobacterium LEGE 13415]|nr:DUF928 domain-containing protein [Pseudanabaenaceae cyanobacterium LEGE 13415]